MSELAIIGQKEQAMGIDIQAPVRKDFLDGLASSNKSTVCVIIFSRWDDSSWFIKR